LNGIKALRKHAEKSLYFSKYDMINEEENLTKIYHDSFLKKKKFK
jgi:hypothetical protein